MFQKIFNQLATLMLLSTVTVSSWALPLIFEFAGTIRETSFTTHPEWIGQNVTGTLTMDLPELAGYTSPRFSQYGKSNDTYPYANWMSFMVRNPDGTLLDISDSEPVIPAPEAEGDDAHTYLAHQSYLYGDSGFYAQRTYNNYLTYPRKHAALSLRAVGEDALWLTSSADYNDVVIKPEFASHTNYGHVNHYTDSGIGHEYSFRIDSLKRIQASVPEPSIWLLFVTGLLMLQCRAFFHKTKNKKQK